MTEPGGKYNNLYLVGLGGTGCNILEAFLHYLTRHVSLLKDVETRTALLAFDVAEPDIAALRKAMGDLEKAMKEAGVQADKVALISDTVRFPATQTLFNFVQRWPEWWDAGASTSVPATAYRPVIDRSIDIPPLVGGVGRQRALSKAIYGLNYHMLKGISPKFENFKANVGQSRRKIVMMVYGMGGGSGSGMALDFARHLRKTLGADVPLFGLGILPCSGDDPAAKGASAYAAIVEHEALVDSNSNRRLVEQLGSAFESPFNAFLTVPLGPAFNRSTSLQEARQLIDEAIVDSLFKTLDFDLADFMSHSGANADPEGRWMNTLTMLQVSIPIREHVELAKLEVERMDQMRRIHNERRPVYGSPERSDDGAINRLLALCEQDVMEGLSTFLRTNDQAATPDQMKVERERRMRDSPTLEKFFKQNLHAQEGPLHAVADDLRLPVRAIGLDAKEGDYKEAIHRQAQEILALMTALPAGHLDFERRAGDLLKDLEKLATFETKLTAQERSIITRDLAEAVFVVGKFLGLLRRTEEIAALCESVHKNLAHSENASRFDGIVKRLAAVQDSEIQIARQLLVTMLSPAEKERRLDYLTSSARAMSRAFERERTDWAAKRDEADLRAKRAKDTLEKATKEQGRLANLLSPTAKRNARDALARAKKDLAAAEEVVADATAAFERADQRLQIYSLVDQRFGVTSEYRRAVADLVRTKERHYTQFNEAQRDRGLYHRVKELTETERLRILQRVLAEEKTIGDEAEESLVTSVIDRTHLKSFLTTALDVFRNPSFLGLTHGYRTDSLWFVALAHQRLWTKDLEDEVKTSLSGYVSHDVDRAIAIRHVPASDRFRLRFLLIAGKARPEELQGFDDMRSLYGKAPEGARKMSHSLALEHGGYLDRSGEFVRFTEATPAPTTREPKVVP